MRNRVRNNANSSPFLMKRTPVRVIKNRKIQGTRDFSIHLVAKRASQPSCSQQTSAARNGISKAILLKADRRSGQKLEEDLMKWIYAYSRGSRSRRDIGIESSDGFTKLAPSVVVVLGYGVAFYLLSLTLNSIPSVFHTRCGRASGLFSFLLSAGDFSIRAWMRLL